EIRMPGNRRGHPGLGQPAPGQDPAPECRRVPAGTASLYHWQGPEAGAKNALLGKQRRLTALHTIQGITAVIGTQALTEHTALPGFSPSLPARAKAESTACLSSPTRLTRPHSPAWVPSRVSPSNSNSAAIREPRCNGMVTVEAASGTNPKSTKAVLNLAERPANTLSQWSNIVVPIPIANPSTAAITGVSQAINSSMKARPAEGFGFSSVARAR